jgi:hypothetical protein
MVDNIKEEQIKEICEALNIPYVSGSLPSSEEIKDKFQNVILDDTAAQLSDYQYSLAEHAFVFGIIYGANYR